MQEDDGEEKGGNGNLKVKVSGEFLELQLSLCFMFSSPEKLLRRGL